MGEHPSTEVELQEIGDRPVGTRILDAVPGIASTQTWIARSPGSCED